MRIWRALKALGCGALRDGVYLLPAGNAHLKSLQELAEETVKEGGGAWLVDMHARTEDDNALFRALFDRSTDYAEFVKALREARKTLSALSVQEITRLQRKLRRDYEALRAIDYFPNEASAQAEAGWSDFVSVAEAALSPDEPQAAAGTIRVLDLKDYQGCLWATRQHLWVDRVASAWLIQRFIDKQARFRWLASPAECPPDALGFDFDEAAFTHVGERVTFEALLASFGLESDPGLMRLAQLVHALDVGGSPLPEATGFEAILAGARQRLPNDDALLAEIGAVLDSLYIHFRNAKQSS